MTDQSGRVLPTSRQAVSPEDPTSPTLAPEAGSGTTGSTEADEGNRVGGTSALSPTTSSAASADASSATRTASLADAERESVRVPGGPAGSPDFGGGSGVGSQGPASTDAPTQPGSADYAGSGYGTIDSLSATRTQSTESVVAESPTTSGTAGAGLATTTGTAGASVLRSPGAKEKAAERAKELVARGKLAGAQAQQNPRVAQVTLTAQQHPLVLRGKELLAQRKASTPGQRRAPATALAPRPEAPPLPQRSDAPRDDDQIVRDISATRTHLAWAVDEINFKIKPANVAARSKAKAQDQVLQPDGSVRSERVGPAVGGLVALLLLRLWRSRRRRKRAARRARALARR